MANGLDTVHSLGMLEGGSSTYLAVNHIYNGDNEEIQVEPSIDVVFEGEDSARVVVSQGALAARYEEGELRLIGEGSAIRGLDRVIGDIAMGGGLVDGAIKPLHPTLFEAKYIEAKAIESRTPKIKVQ